MKILQSWDDGVIDDVRVVEIMKEFNAKATFNLNPGLYQKERSFGWKHNDKEVWRLGIDEMAELYSGFEIAAHSMTHPDLTKCSDEQLVYEIVECRKILQDFFQQEVSGFCYPFGTFDDRIKYFLSIAGYSHARGIGKADNIFPPSDFYEFNPHCHFLSENFWTEFQNAKAAKSEYFFFWGHSYEILNDYHYNDLKEKVKYFSDDSECEWSDISDLFH